MTMQTITLRLPNTLMQRAQLAAQTLQRPLEDVLASVLSLGLPELEIASADMRPELARMTWLSDQELWGIARSQMTDGQQEQLRYLSELQTQRALTPAEKAELEALQLEYGRVTLRKARAYALLSLRGGRPLLTDE